MPTPSNDMAPYSPRRADETPSQHLLRALSDERALRALTTVETPPPAFFMTAAARTARTDPKAAVAAIPASLLAVASRWADRAVVLTAGG